MFRSTCDRTPLGDTEKAILSFSLQFPSVLSSWNERDKLLLKQSHVLKRTEKGSTKSDSQVIHFLHTLDFCWQRDDSLCHFRTLVHLSPWLALQSSLRNTHLKLRLQWEVYEFRNETIMPISIMPARKRSWSEFSSLCANTPWGAAPQGWQQGRDCRPLAGQSDDGKWQQTSGPFFVPMTQARPLKAKYAVLFTFTSEWEQLEGNGVYILIWAIIQDLTI